MYYQNLCKFVVRRFRRLIGKLYPKSKNGLQRKFARLVTNSFFFFFFTLIITFYIWIVKCCHQALYRYSFGRISPNTAPPPAPLPVLASLPVSAMLANNYQLVKVLTSSCFPPYTHHQPDTHTTRAGKDSHNIMIVIIIIISIRLRYILKNTHKNTV